MTTRALALPWSQGAGRNATRFSAVRTISSEPIQCCLARIEAKRRNPCYPLRIMLNDLMTAFLVAFAAVTTSGLISRIWEYF
jgi:hypothetical protein